MSRPKLFKHLPRRVSGLGQRGSKNEVLVAVKRVIDYNVKPRVKMDGTGVDLANVKMSMNPFDEIAVEEAIRLKEKGVATEIVAVSIGPARRRRRCAPRSPWAPTAPSSSRPTRRSSRSRVAKLLAKIAEEEQPQLVILGKQAIDDDNNADRPDARRVARLAAGHVRVEARPRAAAPPSPAKSTAASKPSSKLPAVVTTDLRLNEPRYASLPNIMKAKKKPLATKSPADYGVDVARRLETVRVDRACQAEGRNKVGASTSWSIASRLWGLQNERIGPGRT